MPIADDTAPLAANSTDYADKRDCARTSMSLPLAVPLSITSTEPSTSQLVLLTLALEEYIQYACDWS